MTFAITDFCVRLHPLHRRTSSFSKTTSLLDTWVILNVLLIMLYWSTWTLPSCRQQLGKPYRGCMICKTQKKRKKPTKPRLPKDLAHLFPRAPETQESPKKGFCLAPYPWWVWITSAFPHLRGKSYTPQCKHEYDLRKDTKITFK